MKQSVVKIWFYKDKQPPLGGLVNELRLIRHRTHFHKSKIYLVSNYINSNVESIGYLQEFCSKYHIDLINVYSIRAKIINDKSLADASIQLDLFDMATWEISEEEGNFGAASDIIRTLTPILNLGIYSDLDYEFPSMFEATFLPMIFNGKIYETTSLGPPSYVFNNDILFFENPDCDIAQAFRKIIHDRLFNRYRYEYSNLLYKWLVSSTPFSEITRKKIVDKILGVHQRIENMNDVSDDSAMTKAVVRVMESRRVLKKEEKSVYFTYLTTQIIYQTGPDCLRKLVNTNKLHNCLTGTSPQPSVRALIAYNALQDGSWHPAARQRNETRQMASKISLKKMVQYSRKFGWLSERGNKTESNILPESVVNTVLGEQWNKPI